MVKKKVSIAQLKQELSDKKCFIFGAGIQGKRALLFMDNWGLKDHVAGFADNNPDKQQAGVCIDKKYYRVLSAEQLYQVVNERTIILVASIWHKEIYEQLRWLLYEKECVYISLDEVATIELEQTTYPAVVKEYEEPVIPKIIHYAWFGGDEPEFVKRNVERWRKLCPEYEIMKWDEKNYDVKKNKYMFQAYEQKQWGFVSDYLRLDVVNHYGGIYLDTDIEMLKKPDELLYQDCFGSVDASLTMNLGSGFGAKAHSIALEKHLEYYAELAFLLEDGSLDKTSCNTHSFRLLSKYGIRISNELQKVLDMWIYPMNFQGADQYNRIVKITNQTFWVHYGNMSWFTQSRGTAAEMLTGAYNCAN